MSKKHINRILLTTLLIIGCGSSLRIRDFPSDKSADKNPLLTLQHNYGRNALGSEELIPPLAEDWEENYQSLPQNGFTAVDNWLLFGMLSGYLAAIDIDNGDLEGKKNLGDACAVPPTIYNNLLYQTFETGSKGLIAYDVSDGSSVWAIEDHFSRSSPIIVDDIVLFQSLSGEIIGLQYLTGEEIWRKSLNKNIRNSAAYKDNILITVTLDGSIFALEANSGTTIWRKDLKTPVFADPVIEGNELFVVTHSGKLILIDLLKGESLSEKDFNIELFNSPTIDQNNIYITASNGNLYALKKSSLATVWNFKGEGPIAGSALVTNTYIYLTTLARKLYVIDKNDGELVQKIELVGRARSAPIISQGKLILVCEENRVIAYVENRE
jgi:outer membrane protein assembly factor BamB